MRQYIDRTIRREWKKITLTRRPFNYYRRTVSGPKFKAMCRWCHRTTVFGSPSVMKSPWDSNDGHGQEQVTRASREDLIVQSKFIACTEGAIYGRTRAPRETLRSRTDEIFQFRVYYKTIQQGLPFWHVFH
ncbi:hypothetical protein PTI98_013624 [Pleurotus ostreatus]|nr:hypothetical protein PTI98_013624 [Pleurotus ostreatus]